MNYPIPMDFKLSDAFFEPFKSKKPNLGYNGLGELVFVRTYSRKKEDGKLESFADTLRRVVEGVYSIQKHWIHSNRLEWNAQKAQRSAQEMFTRMFELKMLPPGRSLWALGTDIVMNRGLSASLFNCAFISTKDIDTDVTKPFAYAMDMLMLGVGVGFDTEGAGKVIVKGTKNVPTHTFIIPDSREGWVDSTKMCIAQFFGGAPVEFDYDLIRKAGEPIRGFGGVASGPAPLIELHNEISRILIKRTGQPISIQDIVDMFNLIGKAIISGNVRRSAQISLSSDTSDEFLSLKDYSVHPERAAFGWASNNSVIVDPTEPFDYTRIAEKISNNGEPGVVWLDSWRKYGRFVDAPSYSDARISGVNPCVIGSTIVETNLGSMKMTDVVKAIEHGEHIDVLSYNHNTGAVENRKITDAAKTRKDATCITLKLSDGSSLTLTPDHLVATETGYKKASMLTKEDRIISIS